MCATLEMMDRGRFTFVAMYEDDFDGAVELWEGAENNGAVIRRRVGSHIESLSHHPDGFTLAAFAQDARGFLDLDA
jgi:hypothetical protein